MVGGGFVVRFCRFAMQCDAIEMGWCGRGGKAGLEIKSQWAGECPVCRRYGGAA